MDENEALAVTFIVITAVVFGGLCWVNFGSLVCRKDRGPSGPTMTASDYEDLEDSEVHVCSV